MKKRQKVSETSNVVLPTPLLESKISFKLSLAYCKFFCKLQDVISKIQVVIGNLHVYNCKVTSCFGELKVVIGRL